MNLSIAVSKMLRRTPAVHAAVKQFYTQRQLAAQPVKTPQGYVLRGPAAMQSGEFEPEETAQISELLHDADVFVNIGANVGYYVCLARIQGKDVVAIEPLERNVAILKHNLLLNGWDDVELFPMALGEKPGLAKIYGGGTAASLIPGWTGSSSNSWELIPVTTLDNILGSRFEDRRLLIVMDVEGFELTVLRGALAQLTRRIAPVWFVEVCISEHQPQGVSINPHLLATFEIFWSNGYQATKAGVESGPVSREDVVAWSKGNGLPSTHNFLFRR